VRLAGIALITFPDGEPRRCARQPTSAFLGGPGSVHQP
jgi:hypothetical protein